MNIEPDTIEPRLLYPDDDSVAALHARFGEHVVFTFKGAFTLVHTDAPGEEAIARRTAEFDAGDFFVDSCPLCERQKQTGGYILFARGRSMFDGGR